MSRLLVLALIVSCKTTGDVRPAVTPWIPFDAKNGHVRFAVAINGAEASAILDTGAVGSLIDADFAKAHGIGASLQELTAYGAFGEQQIQTADDFNVAFIGESGPEGDVPVQDAVLLDRELGVDLILGLQFVRGVIIQIDYPNSRFRMMTRSSASIAEQANVPVTSEEDSPRLFVQVEVHGDKEWLMFDTGASGEIYLPRRDARKAGWLDHAKPAGDILARGVTGDRNLEVYLLDVLQIGPYQLEAVPFAVEKARDARERGTSPFSSRVQGGAPAEGILGFDVLRHFVVTLDLEERLLHLYSP